MPGTGAVPEPRDAVECLWGIALTDLTVRGICRLAGRLCCAPNELKILILRHELPIRGRQSACPKLTQANRALLPR